MPVPACACLCLPVPACACLCLPVPACACLCLPVPACACLCYGFLLWLSAPLALCCMTLSPLLIIFHPHQWDIYAGRKLDANGILITRGCPLNCESDPRVISAIAAYKTWKSTGDGT